MGKINEAYKPLYTSRKRYFLVTGGRGSLKSSSVHDFVARLTFEVGHGILFTRYTMTSAEKSIIPEFKTVLKREGLDGFFHITKNVIVNKRTKSFIYFSGIKTNSGDQTANLKSISGITTWIIEEGEDFKDEKAFDAIDDSIRSLSAQNRVIWIQNPAEKEHFIYKRWLESSTKYVNIKGYNVLVSEDEDVEHIHTTYHIGERFLSSGWLKKANKHKQEASLMSDKYASWYYLNYIGGWLEKPEGVIFRDWEPKVFPTHLPFIWGMDFGYTNDPSTLIKCAIENDDYYLQGHLYEKSLSTSQIIDILHEKVDKNDLIVADSAEPRLIDEIYEAGFNIVPAKKGPDSVRSGIRKMQDKNIYLDPSDPNLKKEFNNHCWSNKRAGVPIDDYNHYIDPARYALEELEHDSDFFFG